MMEPSVTILQLEEPARFNPDRLERLCAEIGELRAEDEVARALEVISARLQEIEALDPLRDAEALAKRLRALITASDHIGMATLARVGRNVQACLARHDTVALAATHSRLIRVGDRSIHAIWDLEDLSG
jgi:hypothetical protein